MIDLFAAIAAGITTVVGAAGFFAGRSSKRGTVRLEEDRCTGYRVDGKGYDEPKNKTDCKALRSPTCSDGRCSYHCQYMCRCDMPTGRGLDGKFAAKR